MRTKCSSFLFKNSLDVPSYDALVIIGAFLTLQATELLLVCPFREMKKGKTEEQKTISEVF